jgi:methylmalonyl-CoA carboxyltransferase 5S subunit
MFPQVSAAFFAKRDQGPLNLGRDPEAAKPAADGKAAAGGADKALTTPVTYDVKLNGRSHRVSVTPVTA